ncbi:unnamed protein product [Mytilus coruscus]|uniref:Reverse transcriptase domain-containing protein n=1 Tax=Mytilus coruscus TaxID=42192 RepID=A0A6J8CML7_MYTCO|nr:unnamed protein product [Mytilus coruscus]
MYEGKIYECNGYNSRQGVAIMVANSVKDKTKLVYKDDEGRFIHVSYETDGQIFNFVSVYAPNNCIERARYFKFVNSYIENLQNVIIGGDFNTTLSNLDKGEKYKQESNSVKELYNENDEIVNDTDGILDIEYNFYKDLYSCVEIETDKLCDFLQHVDKKVNDDDKEICDSDITFNEIAEALSSMSKNKSPGSDGLTTEFYCTFYDSLREILYKVFNAVYDEGILSRSMRSGVISLIFKKKGDRRAEPLQCMISNNCNISGINIPMSEKVCKMFQHADDTTVTVSDKKSIDEVFNVFELYGETWVLPQNAIVEIVAKGNDEYDIDSIIKRYRSLQSALPELWTNTVGTEVYHRTNNRKIDINLNMNCKLVDFKMCSSKQLYCLVIEKLCQPPKSVDKWMNIFPEDESIMHKVWKIVNMFWKPSIMTELDFKIAHCGIFTNERLLKMKLVDNDLCDICCNEIEDIMHLFYKMF